ncbi:Rho-related GTP-binding protein RhoA-B [Dirofilaria immitis]
MTHRSEYLIYPMNSHSEYYMDKGRSYHQKIVKQSKTHTEVKCVIVGDSKVGKTMMLKTLINMENICIFPKYEPTVFDFEGLNYTNKLLEPFFFKIFDTSGKSYFDRLRQLTFLDANIIIICYSIDSRKSFWNAHHRWYDEIQYGFCPKNIPFILAATKTDLRNDQDTINRLKAENTITVSAEEGKKLAERIGAYAYTECTCKNRESIFEVFRIALKSYCDFYNATETEQNKYFKDKLKSKLKYRKNICFIS